MCACRPGRKRGHDPAISFLDESRQLQPQARAIRDTARGMMMPNDLDQSLSRGRAMTMMKIEAARFPGVEQSNAAIEMAVVVPGQHDDFARVGKSVD